jgi:hypothetical protein
MAEIDTSPLESVREAATLFDPRSDRFNSINRINTLANPGRGDRRLNQGARHLQAAARSEREHQWVLYYPNFKGR